MNLVNTIAVRAHPFPKHWHPMRLGDACTLVGDTIDPQAFATEGFAHYSIPSFDFNRLPIMENGACILSTKILFPRGAVLFSKLNPRISRVWHVSDDHQCRRICSTEFLPLVPRQQLLDPDFLAFLLQDPLTIQHLRLKVAAATKSRERLRPDDVLATPIALPPLPEQRRIAARLRAQMEAVGRATTAAESQDKDAAALLSSYLKNIFDRLAACSCQKWCLGDLLVARREVVHPRDNPCGPAVFVGLEHIESTTGRRIGSVPVEMSRLTGRKPRFAKGDIVYGYLRPYLNKVWIAEFEGLCSVDQFAYEVRGDSLDAEYIAWFMRSPTYLRLSQVQTTTGQLPRIGVEEVAAVQLPFPAMAERHATAKRINCYFERLRGLRSGIETTTIAIESLPAALLRDAFSGRL